LSGFYTSDTSSVHFPILFDLTSPVVWLTVAIYLVSSIMFQLYIDPEPPTALIVKVSSVGRP